MHVCIFTVHLTREFKTREFDSQFAGSNEAAKECAIKTKVRSFIPLHRGAFAIFLSGGFTTMTVKDSPERKLAKHTSVHWNRVHV